MEYRSKPNSYVFADTPCGKMKGIRKDGYLLYKGIRYATAKRWEDPKLVKHWKGELDATKYGPLCCQNDTFFDSVSAGYAKFYYDQNAEKPIYEYSEDCLNLNIWAPENAKNAPVTVFIHGGSFVSGGNSVANISNGADYCKRGIILVTVNYRLNAFANAYDKEHGGNYALKDQIASLIWVKNNIAAFGGDPNHIVGIGESAGALSLQCLLYSPKAKGLLSGSIMMSGGGNLEVLGVPARPESTEVVWSLVMEKFGVSSINELKDVPAKEIYTAWCEAAASDINLSNNCAKPIIDGDVIPGCVAELVAAGTINDMPCVFGLSSEDMYPYALYTKAVEWGAYQVQAGRSPVYAYYMDRQLPGDNAGAYHGCDLWYAFGTLDRNWRPFTEIDYRISENMIDYFAAFIKTGSPNAEGLPKWEPLTQSESKFIRFGDAEPAMYEPPVAKLITAIQNTLKPFPGM